MSIKYSTVRLGSAQGSVKISNYDRHAGNWVSAPKSSSPGDVAVTWQPLVTRVPASGVIRVGQPSSGEVVRWSSLGLILVQLKKTHVCLAIQGITLSGSHAHTRGHGNLNPT